MTKKQRIGLLGGAFDPPHAGHIHLAQAATDSLQLDKVLWIPTATPVHREPLIASATHRVNMVNVCIAQEPKWQVSTCEIERAGGSYFIDTLRYFLQQYPEAIFYVLLGGDQLAAFTSWDEWREILANSSLAVLARPNCADFTDLPAELATSSIDSASQQTPETTGRVLLLNAEPIAVSATELRQCLAQGKHPDTCPECVLTYLATHHIYR